MRARTALGSLALIGTLTVLSACGGSGGSSAQTKSTPTSSAADASPAGDIPDTQAYVPFRPMTHTRSRGSIWSETSSRSGRCPNATEIRSRERRGM